MSKSVIEKLKEAAQPEIANLTEELKRERDELKLQLHLLGAEAKEEWEEIEENFKHFSRKANDVSYEIEKLGEEGAEAVKRLGHSVKQAYQKMRNAIK